MDLAAAAAGIRATRKSQLRAGWSSWRTWAGAIPLAERPRDLLECHRRDGTAGTPELIYRCNNLRAAPLSVTTAGRVEQPEDGPRRCRRRSRKTLSGLLRAGWSGWRTWARAIPLNDRATFQERADALVRRTGLGAD
jgi:hypothetical protein